MQELIIKNYLNKNDVVSGKVKTMKSSLFPNLYVHYLIDIMQIYQYSHKFLPFHPIYIYSH